MNLLRDTAPLRVVRPTIVRHLVLAALCVITSINYVQRNSLGGAETMVRRDLALERNDTGDAMSAFFLTYALCQVPSGWLAQRLGGRWTLALFAAGWSVVMGLTALATGLPELLGARWAMGALQAGIFPCSTLILAAWYPSTRRGFASAVLTSFMLIGGVIASLLTGLLIGPLGWRWLFLLYALPGLAWAGWFAWWFRDSPRDHPGVNNAELAVIGSGTPPPMPSPPPTLPDSSRAPAGAESRSITVKPDGIAPLPGIQTKPPSGGRQPPETLRTQGADAPRSERTAWLAIIFSSALWLICIQQFCRSGAIRLFDQWLPTYLQEARGQDVGSANLWTGVPLWAAVFGSLVGGIVSDAVLARTGSRRAGRQGVAIASVLLALLCFWLAYHIPSVGWAVAMAGLGVGLFSFSSPVAYALTMDMGGKNLGVIFGTMNMAGNLGSWAFTKYIPRVVSWGGWDAGLAVFAGMLLLAVLCWLPINPNGVIGERPDAPLDKEHTP